MSKPTEVPVWATDANYTSGALIGQPTKQDPGAGVKAQGHVPDTSAGPRQMNWWKNLVGQWISWADGLGFDVDAGGDWEYVDGSGTPTPKSRTIFVDAFSCAHTTGWAPAAGSGTEQAIVSSVGSAVARYGFSFLPDGAEITAIRALVDPGGASAMTFRLQHQTITLATPAVGAVTDVIGPTSSGTSLQWLSGTLGGNIPINKAGGKVVSAAIVSGQGSDLFYGFEVSFLDPGPRNA